MIKRILVLLVMVSTLATTSASYAILRDDIGYAYGKVIQHDKTNSQITIEDYYTGQEMVFTLNESQNETVANNSEITLTFDLNSKEVKFFKIVEPKQ